MLFGMDVADKLLHSNVGIIIIIVILIVLAVVLAVADYWAVCCYHAVVCAVTAFAASKVRRVSDKTTFSTRSGDCRCIQKSTCEGVLGHLTPENVPIDAFAVHLETLSHLLEKNGVTECK